MPRTLSRAPQSFLDPSTGSPALGSYEGPLPRIDVSKHLIDRAFRRKKWLYLGIASDEIWLSMAIVRMGYATNAFAFVLDRGTSKDENRGGKSAPPKMIAEETVIGPPRAASIADDIQIDGVLGRFGSGKASVSVERRAGAVELRARFGELQIDAELDMTNAPPAISAIAELGSPSLVSATEKRVLANVRGSITIGPGSSGRRITLDQKTNAIGAYDYTHGLMPRHTKWRWAMGLGRTRDGRPIAFNVTSGFVGEAECAAFLGDTRTVHPINEPRFTFDVERPQEPWRLQGDGIDLTFDVGAVHAQKTNLVLVRSKFLQPAGHFRGTLRIDGKDVELDSVPGVVEDQDVLW